MLIFGYFWHNHKNNGIIKLKLVLSDCKWGWFMLNKNLRVSKKNYNKFLEYSYTKSLKQMQIYIIIGIFIYDIFGLIDVYAVPELRNMFWSIRYLFFTPLALMVFALAFSKYFKRLYQIAISILSILGGGGLILINSMAITHGFFSYKYGIWIAIIFIYILSGLRYTYAIVSGWSLIVIYNLISLTYKNTPTFEYVDTNIMLVIFSIVGMISCYFMGSYERKNYELIAMLKLEKDKVKKANDFTFQRIFEGSSDTIFIIEKSIIVDCNLAAINHFGYNHKEEIIGKNFWEISPEKQLDGLNSKEKLQTIIKEININSKARFEWWHIKKDGAKFPVEVIMTSILIGGRKVLHALCRDVSERKELEDKLVYLSYRDQLTNLYNRRFFEEKLKSIDVEGNLPLTLVIGDVNGLKLINDSFGHAVGDELLKSVADVIVSCCRIDDIIARLGGDEFVILLPKTKSYEAEHIINNIKALAQDNKFQLIDISISFGWETKIKIGENISEIFKRAEDQMYKNKLFEGPSMRGKTVTAIISTLHEKNKREEQHSHRVSELCKKTGEALNLNETQIQELKMVGLLHDIGKIAIDENILNKPGKLSDEERSEINRHPEIGYRILSTVNDMTEIAQYVLYHHERWDGSGYPKGLKGDEIPFVSRIITIADSYDAMTSERSYRSALSEEVATQELQKNVGIQFDAELVSVFIEKVLGQKQ